MSSDETRSAIDAMSLSVRITNKLMNDFNKSDEKITTEMLATAIKLASIPIDHQQKLTLRTVNAAINSLNQEKQYQNLTPESLAIAIKLAIKEFESISSDNNNQFITPEILADALKLANE